MCVYLERSVLPFCGRDYRLSRGLKPGSRSPACPTGKISLCRKDSPPSRERKGRERERERESKGEARKRGRRAGKGERLVRAVYISYFEYSFGWNIVLVTIQQHSHGQIRLSDSFFSLWS